MSIGDPALAQIPQGVQRGRGLKVPTHGFGSFCSAFAAGHVAGSVNIGLAGQFVTYLGWLLPWGSPVIPIHEILARLDEVPAGPVWVHCAGGYRAGIVASLLRGRGHDIVAVDDDFAHAVAAGLTTSTTDQAAALLQQLPAAALLPAGATVGVLAAVAGGCALIPARCPLHIIGHAGTARVP
jgi:rhodanese-related sulfurtransferase